MDGRESERLPADLRRVLLGEEEIRRRVEELAARIDADCPESAGPLLVVGVLKGAFIFTADLSRRLRRRHVVDFIAVSSYEGGQTSGNVRLMMDTRQNMEGRHVLVVEDILDSGCTLDFLVRSFRQRNPLSVRTAVLLDKPARHVLPLKVDYLGFSIPDVWVVGYGLDYDEQYRTLPFIAEMSPPAGG
ncbi:MAG: hypoxanthine phosphoribosyltransferase [Kiritimatiellae bacterium]|nr:hypoxanthine phosphoribosyltransferase [Kiritimatiellia bacterium]MBR4253445.1 hypoxanthine phosphoribosyltransferase [Kiritimatiellia bacterium]